MKKIASLILAILMVVCLCACSEDPANQVSTEPPTATTAELLDYPKNVDGVYWDYAVSIPKIIYSTPAKENGLAANVYVFEGTVVDRISLGDDSQFDSAIVETQDGKVMVANLYKAIYEMLVEEFGESDAQSALPDDVSGYALPEVGESARFIAIYDGYSETYEMPLFYLGANDYLLDLLQEESATESETEAETEIETQAATQPPETTPPISTQPQISSPTTGERNALRSAKSYLSFMAFSYTGLIEQLEYEGYTTAEAIYAADNCGADWYEQAVKSAESYLSFMGFSRSGLIEQLEFDGFTHEQAVYGVEQNGL